MKTSCEACGERESFGIANGLGPVSIARCAYCMRSHIYPWWNVVGYLNCAYEDLHPAYRELLDVNLHFHNKTREEWEADVEEMWEGYTKAMEEGTTKADG